MNKRVKIICRQFLIIMFIGCLQHASYAIGVTTIQQIQTDTMTTGNYATVNGLKMYYEMHGEGKPLVLIHGGGSTIETTFVNILPLFAKRYKVIAVELQAHCLL